MKRAEAIKNLSIEEKLQLQLLLNQDLRQGNQKIYDNDKQSEEITSSIT